MSKSKSTTTIEAERSPTHALKSAAYSLGFTLTGVCPAVAPTGISHLAEWLDRGYAGEMHYIAARQDAYSHPRHILGGVRSILMLGLPYGGQVQGSRFKVQSSSSSNSTLNLELGTWNFASHGRISRYALGTDYHDVIHDKLKQLITVLQQIAPDASARGVVDTAPLLEREFARLAGLGWIGKHTLLIHRERPNAIPLPSGEGGDRRSPGEGSYFFLAALLTDLALDYDEPFTADHCGTCRACLDACPTQAFPEPYVLDATRCISYLTIELKSPIPRELRPGIGDWLFGCDVCQDVCPWNQHIQARSASEGLGSQNVRPPVTLQSSEPADPTIELTFLFSLDDAAFRRRFRHTPLWRPRRRGILRNAAIVLGNQFRGAGISPVTKTRSASDDTLARSASEGNPVSTAVIAAVTRGLNDAEPLIRGASAWALGQISGNESQAALQARQAVETDPTVRDEIDAALKQDAAH